MDINDILFLGLHHSVTAISKSDGRKLWATKLPSGTFVTLLSDGRRIFAYSGGHLYCLDLTTGQILWKNELAGYGYGLASLALPDGTSAPDTSTIRRIMDDRTATSSPSHTPPTTTM